MNTEPVSKTRSTFVPKLRQAWNTSYVTQDGFVCRITLRGETGKDLLDKASVALSYLMEHGFQPERSQRRGYQAMSDPSSRDEEVREERQVLVQP